MQYMAKKTEISLSPFHLLGPAWQPIINFGMLIPTSKTAASKTPARKLALLAVAVFLAVVGYFGFRMIWGLMMRGYVDSAIFRMRVLNAAETQFAKEHSALGYTCKLSELPSSAEIVRLLAKGSIDNGYAFEIVGCHAADAQAPNPVYYISARPLHSRQPAFCSDQSGIVKADYGGSVEGCRSNGVPL
jgi:hypothetical protein